MKRDKFSIDRIVQNRNSRDKVISFHASPLLIAEKAQLFVEPFFNSDLQISKIQCTRPVMNLKSGIETAPKFHVNGGV
jgi:hypothetical protein